MVVADCRYTGVSVFVAISAFQLYSFGEIVSIVMWTDSWQPDSYYEKIARNMEHGLHTLCLLGAPWLKTLECVFLDIKTKEQSVENLMKYVVCLSTKTPGNSEAAKCTNHHGT